MTIFQTDTTTTNIKCDNCIGQIIDACKKSDHCAVKSLLESSIIIPQNMECPNCSSYLTGKIIEIACEVGNLEIVEMLIDNNNYLDLECSWMDVVIHIACGRGHKNLVEYFIEHELEYDLMMDQLTPIDCAVIGGHLDVIKLLVSNGIDLSQRRIPRPDSIDIYFENKQPIHFAAEGNSVEIFKYLIDNDSDLESLDSELKRPIHYASSNSNPIFFEILVKYHVSLECQTIYKQKPIHMVCQYGSLVALQILIKNGVKLNCVDLFGKTPLDYATHVRKDDQIIKCLIDALNSSAS